MQTGEQNVIYVCCLCTPDPKADADALVLYNRECPSHGQSWHRKMIVEADGSLRLAGQGERAEN